MSNKREQVSGSYEKGIKDSGDGQASNKFSKYPTSVVTDKLPKPTDKGQGVGKPATPQHA